jgi:hypothetical protein
MKPDEFANQFFDLWQQSVGQMMRDPAFSQRMVELMQQADRFWPNGAANQTSAANKSPDDLAYRLELCEQRLSVMETLIRQWAGNPQPPHALSGVGEDE